MPVIRANREAIDDRFSVLGFSIRSEQPWFEVGLATDPSLFRPENRGRRTPRNFYSSRAQGPQPARRGEAVYLLPADVLQHFIGQPRLYFGLATYRDSAGSAPVHVQVPTTAHMYVSLGGLTERGLRRLTSAANAPSAYGTPVPGSQAALTWGGDLSAANQAPAAAPASTSPRAGVATARAPEPAAAAALEYDDGFSASLWQQPAYPVVEAQELLLDPPYRSTDPVQSLIDHARLLASSVPWFLGVPSTRAFPHSAICQLRGVVNGREVGFGSAYYVGRNLLLTAGHNIVEARRAGITQLIIVPGKNGDGVSRDTEFLGRTSVPIGTEARPVNSHCQVHPQYSPTGNHDMAVIKCPLDAPGGRWFAMDELRQSTARGVAVCGYSMSTRRDDRLSRLVGRTINPDRQHLHGGHIRSLEGGDEGRFTYDIQTLRGASGSPVYDVVPGDRPRVVAVGIHVGGVPNLSAADQIDEQVNQGVRLTTAKIAWVRAQARALTAAVGLSADDDGDEMQNDAGGATVVEAQELLLDPPYRSNDAAQSLADHIRLLASSVPWFLGVPNTRIFPHSAICQFRMATASGDDSFGSGFYIGRNLVLTAKHVVDGGPAQLIIVPGKNGAGTGASNEPLGRFTVANTNANVRKHPTLDIAIVKVPNNAPGGRWFAIEELTQSRPWGVAVCGYSMQSNNTDLIHRLVNRTINQDKQHLHGGRILSIEDRDGSFAYDIQTLAGASGSPVYEVVPGTRPRVVAVGVHVSNNDRATNRGMRITQAVITWIRQQANGLSAAVGLGFDGDEFSDALSSEEPAADDSYREDESTAQALGEGADTYSEAQTIPGTELRPVDIKLRTFIPSPAIYADVPVLADRAFVGDGRGFQYSGGTSRAEIRARFEFSNGSSGSRPRLTVLDRHWGESQEFNTSDVVTVSGKPAWWRAIRSGAQPIGRATHTATSSNLRAQLGGSSHEGIYSMAEGSVVVGLGVEGNLPLMRGSFDIDVNLYVHLRVRNQKVQAKVRGSHDGFPASEVYVNQVRVYGYDPVAAGHGPNALFGTGNWDINVDTPWVDVGDASDVRLIGPVRIQGDDSEAFGAEEEAAEAFAIPLDPGPGGRSISAAALQIGDLIVSTARHPVSYAIRAGTVSSVSHAMLYVGDGHVVEAVGSGVRRVPVATALSGAILAVAYRRSGITSSQARAVADFAVRHVGRPYNYAGAARHAVRITHPILSRIADAIARGAGLRRDEAASFFCSELVYAAFEAAGVPLSTTAAADGTPASLPSLLGGTLGYVGHLVASDTPFGIPLALGDADSETPAPGLDVMHPLTLQAQPDKRSGWAAALAMLLNFRSLPGADPARVSERMGAEALLRHDVDALARTASLGFARVADASAERLRDPQAWADWLRRHGPLWCGVLGTRHAMVVHGLRLVSSGVEVNVANPWDMRATFDADPVVFRPANQGCTLALPFQRFVDEFLRMAGNDASRWALLHLPAKALAQPSGVDDGLADPPPPVSAFDAEELGFGSVSGSDREEPIDAHDFPGARVFRRHGQRGGVRYQLDRLEGAHRPAMSPAAVLPLRPAEFRIDDWPRASGGAMPLPLTVHFEHDGSAVANLRIEPVGPADNVGEVVLDARLSVGNSPQPGLGAVVIDLGWRFASMAGAPQARTRVVVYGNGRHAIEHQRG